MVSQSRPRIFSHLRDPRDRAPFRSRSFTPPGFCVTCRWALTSMGTLAPAGVTNAVDAILARLAGVRSAPAVVRPGMPGGLPMRNFIHDRPAIQIGSPGAADHVTEPGWIYRTLTDAELLDAAEYGLFLPKRSGRSSGGQMNAKHWVRGGTGDPVQFFRGDIPKRVVRVPADLVPESRPVRYGDALLADPSAWRWFPLPVGH